MTRFTRTALAILLCASSFAISQTPASSAPSPEAPAMKMALPQEVHAFLAVGQDASRSGCITSCQSSHTSCLSSATTDNARSACEKAQAACNSACPKNKD